LTEIERLRKARGLSKNELARKAGVATSTISRMETDPNELDGGIGIEAASLVAKALGEDVHKAFPDTTLNYTQGRPPQTGKPIDRKRHMPMGLCEACGMSVSESERVKDVSECHEARVRTS